MRELRVIGLSPDGKQIVCVDTANGQKFRIPADEKLRAASRGDMSRLGQIEVELESSLRPRDIQARIRNGASVEQVAAESGMAVHRVETFAYPVMLERSRAAQLAQKGHPVRPDGPAVATLAEVIGTAFRGRGHEIDSAEWDAWKDDEGYWVAQLQWSAGRSVNAAHWRFLPDAHGGTVICLDDPAHDLCDPDFGRPLRGLAPVVAGPSDEPSEVEADETGSEQPTSEAEEPVAEEEPVEEPKPAPTHATNRDKRGKPAMPSWDEVLLGVRSSGH
ncbi:MAG TPA: septation protein SepH [Aldersonia sp.]